MASSSQARTPNLKGILSFLCTISVEKQLQCICGTAALCGFLYGYSMAASAVMLTQETFVDHFCVGIFGTMEECYSTDLSEQPIKWIHYTTQVTAMLSLGTVVGALLSSWLADTFGRRKALLVGTLIYAIFTAWETAIYLKISMLLARFLSGIGVGISVAVAPIYIMELTPPHLRGKMCGMLPLSLCVGELSAGIIGEWYEEQSNGWRYVVGFAALVAIIMMTGLLIFPESPRWLYAIEGKEECAKTLQILRQREDVTSEVEAIAAQAAVESQSSSKEPLVSSSLFGRKMRRRTIIACSLQLVQQLSGIVLLLAYGTVVLEMVGVSRTLVVLTILFLMNGLGTLVALQQVDTSGRRKLLIQGGIGTFLTNLGAAIALKIGRVEDLNSSDVSDDMKLALASVFLFFASMFMLFFAASFGLVPWIYAAEIFPLKSRATAVGMANVTHAIAFYLATFFQNLINSTNLAFTYLFCAVCCLVSTVFIILYVPETAGKTMDEIDLAFKREAWHDDDWKWPCLLRMKSSSKTGEDEEDMLLSKKGKKKTEFRV
mmetsp:Transcript_28736/g.37715  ORF Transcript_28736/g.37715 Transcript_28736/m.37715 type:complete len:546 (+) Transcript_28736:58-1695(+)